jgi:hypothetical protein
MPNVRITIDAEGVTEIAAYCLTTDSWQDYLAFREEARTAIDTGDQRSANRYLRAALHCVFAHLEGVIGKIEKECEIETVYGKGRLCDRTRNVDRQAKKRGFVPHINFRFEKHMRDIISHPGITKWFFDEAVGEATVFEKLDVETIGAVGSRVGAWLDAACNNLGVDRFTDTKGLVEHFSNALGSGPGPREV